MRCLLFTHLVNNISFILATSSRKVKVSPPSESPSVPSSSMVSVPSSLSLELLPASARSPKCSCRLGAAMLPRMLPVLARIVELHRTMSHRPCFPLQDFGAAIQKPLSTMFHARMGKEVSTLVRAAATFAHLYRRSWPGGNRPSIQSGEQLTPLRQLCGCPDNSAILMWSQSRCGSSLAHGLRQRAAHVRSRPYPVHHHAIPISVCSRAR